MESSVIRVMGPRGERARNCRRPSPSWARRLEETGTDSLRGFSVEAADGEAGRIDQVLYWSEAERPDYVVVSEGRWFSRRRSVLSIKVIESVDTANRRLKVSMSREEIRQAPGYLPWT